MQLYNRATIRTTQASRLPETGQSMQQDLVMRAWDKSHRAPPAASHAQWLSSALTSHHPDQPNTIKSQTKSKVFPFLFRSRAVASGHLRSWDCEI